MAKLKSTPLDKPRMARYLTGQVFPELAGLRKGVHFVGVGGIGMSALARWFLAQRANPEQGRRVGSPKGWSSKIAVKRLVSGSDLATSGITRELSKEGLKVKIGHKRGYISPKLGLVVYSLAVNSSNPELREARRLKIPNIPYPVAVGRLTETYKTIAIAGAHGKSTTTALVSLILRKAGLDPTVIVGTNLKEFARSTGSGQGGKNFRAGRSQYLVLEADEFGRSFLHYSPTLAVITNIDREHLDTYKNLPEIKKAFLKFISNVKGGGAVILNKDSAHLLSLKNKISHIARQKKLKVFWYSIKRARNSQHSYVFADLHRVLKVPGEHNASNALAAYTVGRALNIPRKKILSAISQYHGSWRRMEYRGSCYVSRVSCRVYDDYAHHPTEIKATLKAFKEKYSHSPIICIYQPHQALRLKKLFKEFLTAFDLADILILLPIYQVAGRDKIDKRYTSKKLAEAIKKKYPKKTSVLSSQPQKNKTFLV